MHTKIHRAYNQSYVENNIFIKISQNDRLADEILFYQHIQNYPQKCLFAEFIGNYSNGLTYALALKNYQNYINLYQLLTISNEVKIINVLDLLFEKIDILHIYVDDYLHNTNIIYFTKNNHQMLIEKTEDEYKKLLNIDFFKQMNNKIIINSVEYDNFNVLWQQIKPIIEEFYLEFNIGIIHGDLCFSNILVNPETLDLLFVDPRGSYGLRGCFGDQSYDIAKILHSVDGKYEHIIFDKFDLIYDHNNIQFKFLDDYQFVYQYVLQKIINLNIDIEKAQLIQGLIFIGMCARHYDSFERQLIMYCTGIMILNNWLNQYNQLSLV